MPLTSVISSSIHTRVISEDRGLTFAGVPIEVITAVAFEALARPVTATPASVLAWVLIACQTF